MRPLSGDPAHDGGIGDTEARIIADHLEARHLAVLDAAVAFDDPGLAAILHHVRVTNR